MKYGRIASIVSGILAAAVIASTQFAWAQDKPASGRVAPQAEATLAAEMIRLGQPNLIKAVADNASKRAAVNQGKIDQMWKAQAIRAQWTELATSRTAIRKNADDYVAGMNAYLDSIKGLTVADAKGKQVPQVADGFWAVDHMKFILETATSLTVARIETNGANERDREELLPLATLALKLCDIAEDSLQAIQEDDMERPGFQQRLEVAGELAPYTRVESVKNYPGYYRLSARYTMALALDPAKDGTKRAELLNKTVEELTKNWIEIEDPINTYVLDKNLMLRGKCSMELGKISVAKGALADFAAAVSPKNAVEGKVDPNTAYESMTQTVVAKMRAKDFVGAHAGVEALRANSPLKPRNDDEKMYAKVTFDMLDFRVSWNEAIATTDGKPEAEKQAARLKALKPLGELANTVPEGYRALIYEALMSQTSPAEEAEALTGKTKLLPLQALAISWNRYQQGKGGDAAKKDKVYPDALRMAETVKTNPQATPTEKLEAIYVSAAIAVDKEDRENAIRNCIEYAELADANDKRLKSMATEAMQQLDEVRKKGGGAIPDAIQPLVERAIVVSGEKLKDPKWQYALGNVYLKRSDKQKDDASLLQKAEDAFKRVPKDDPFFVSAMFQRLVTSGKRLSFAQNDPVAAKDAGAKFLKACADYRKDVTDPNSPLPKEALEKARAKLMDLTLWEISVSLDPMQDADNVLKRVDELEKGLGDKATEDQQVSFLQYRIKAYIIKKESDKAVKAADEFVKRYPERGTALMQGMVTKWQDEIEDAVSKKQKDRATELSRQLVDLLSSLIEVTKSKPIMATDEAGKAKEEAEKKSKIYKYQQFQGQTMVAGAQYQRAIDQFAALEKEKPEDAFNKFWTAHAYFADGKYLEAQKIYSELISRLRADSGPWWECYYRMIKANEFLIPKSNPTDQIKRQQQNNDALKDLTAMYGREKIGGEKLHAEFVELLNVYKTPDMSAPKPAGT